MRSKKQKVENKKNKNENREQKRTRGNCEAEDFQYQQIFLLKNIIKYKQQIIKKIKNKKVQQGSWNKDHGSWIKDLGPWTWHE